MSNLLVSRIDERPDFPLLRVALEPGQKVFAEPGAMVTMTSGVKLSAGLRGGIGATIGRAFGGGEALEFHARLGHRCGRAPSCPISIGGTSSPRPAQAKKNPGCLEAAGVNLQA